MSEMIRLFHGTSYDVIGGAVVSGKIPLIGKRVLDDPSLSGTLTDEFDFAANWARRKRGGDPIVLTFMLPKSAIIDEGIIAFKDSARGFVTNFEIDYKTLAKKYPAYLTALFGFNMLDKKIVEFMVRRGNLSFHTVPFKYLTNQEDV